MHKHTPARSRAHVHTRAHINTPSPRRLPSRMHPLHPPPLPHAQLSFLVRTCSALKSLTTSSTPSSSVFKPKYPSHVQPSLLVHVQPSCPSHVQHYTPCTCPALRSVYMSSTTLLVHVQQHLHLVRVQQHHLLKRSQHSLLVGVQQRLLDVRECQHRICMCTAQGLRHDRVHHTKVYELGRRDAEGLGGLRAAKTNKM